LLAALVLPHLILMAVAAVVHQRWELLVQLMQEMEAQVHQAVLQAQPSVTRAAVAVGLIVELAVLQHLVEALAGQQELPEQQGQQIAAAEAVAAAQLLTVLTVVLEFW
jgi:hypothetical protein